MKNTFVHIRRTRIAVLLGLSLVSLGALADDAQIVMVLGKVEVQQNAQGGWRQAVVNQKLNAGDAVRTGEASQMALLASDQTQVRLSQQSVFKLKTVGNQDGGTALELQQGRMWAQAKQFFTGIFRRTTSLVGGQQPRRLQVTTPTSTIGIRGTDWEVTVGEAGTTRVAVFTGEVEVGNEFGQVLVAPNEQATVQAGKAPVKVLLSNAKDRVQWVTAYRPTPRRWVPSPSAELATSVKAIEAGDYAGALAGLQPQAKSSTPAALLLADMYLFLGQADDAIALLAPASRGGAGDPQATALTARALTVAGRMDEAAKLLASGLAQQPGNRELLLAQADLARLQGDGNTALNLFTQVAAADANSHEAWFGVGRIQNEKENVNPAKAALDNAIRLSPQSPGYHGELATLQTLTNDLPAARASFDEALKQQPDDYLAWTGLGILQLKAGQPDQALQSFLKAGVLEPRFARAQLYTAVAYYQLGNYGRALETVKKATEQDPRDPLPYVMLGLMQGDALDLGAAVDAAREAQVRMPYLKSLNPIANDQKGSANLGSALANFGAEEWASYYASQAYSPYWAGSHLFLADRYIGKFNKNSELFTGFLTDPTVFGASNRDASLVAVPGNYGRIDLSAERSNRRSYDMAATVNGLTSTSAPFAYFFSADLNSASGLVDDTNGHERNFTLGLGLRPNYNTALFAFVTDRNGNSVIRNATVLEDPEMQTERREDLGLNVKLANDNQLWFKLGRGYQHNDITGPYFSQNTADSFNAQLGRLIFPRVISATGSLDRLRLNVDQNDAQFRQAFTAGDVQWNWGLESSRQSKVGTVVTTFAPVRLNSADDFNMDAKDAYLSARYKSPQGNQAQVDLFAQHYNVKRSALSSVDILLNPVLTAPNEDTKVRQDTSELNLRLGYQWQVAPYQSLRLVAQRWRMPASAGTLASLDTLGIPVNDRLVQPGGLYQRARLQYDGESSPSLFFQAFLDHEVLDNGLAGVRTTTGDFQVEQLQQLRNTTQIFAPVPDMEETATFVKGTVSTLGLAANVRVSKNQMLSARYLFRTNEQQGDNAGLNVPFVPRHFLLLGSQWSPGDRWLFGASALYRSARYQDDLNSELLQAGWSFGLNAYWESLDKRSAVQIILDNMLSNTKAAVQSDAHLLIKYTARF
jgi:tetratricopeptide (TPR) repeat protein